MAEVKDSDSPNAINLGFAELLNPEKTEPAAEIGPLDERPFEEVLAAHEEMTDAAARFDDLWSKKEFAEILSLAESPLPADDKPLLRRLWWIRAQEARGELPVQVLCSSFEECLSTEHDTTLPVALVQATALQLARRLDDAGEEGLAIAVLERCNAAAPGREISALLISLIQKELDELPKRLTFHTPFEMKKRLHLLDLKRLLDEDLKHDSGGFELGSVPPPEAERTPDPLPFLPKNPDHMRLASAVAVIGIALYGLWFLLRHELFPKTPEILAGELEPGTPPREMLLHPEVSRIRDVSQLAAVMYDVEKTPGEAVPAVSSAPAPKPKATINTQGPIETDRIRAIIDGTGGSRYEDGADTVPRFPRENDRGLSRAPIVRDDQGRNDRRRDEERRYDRDRAQTWAGGERYEIMINTTVMEQPSFHAGEVAELYVGDRVLVEARLGRWLRIRSVKGKSGYIMAQDAQKLYDR